MNPAPTPGIAELLDAYESDVRWACSEDWFGMDPVAAVKCSHANIIAHVAGLEREIERLREYEWKYKELCK